MLCVLHLSFINVTMVSKKCTKWQHNLVFHDFVKLGDDFLWEQVLYGLLFLVTRMMKTSFNLPTCCSRNSVLPFIKIRFVDVILQSVFFSWLDYDANICALVLAAFTVRRNFIKLHCKKVIINVTNHCVRWNQNCWRHICATQSLIIFDKHISFHWTVFVFCIRWIVAVCKVELFYNYKF